MCEYSTLYSFLHVYSFNINYLPLDWSFSLVGWLHDYPKLPKWTCKTDYNWCKCHQVGLKVFLQELAVRVELEKRESERVREWMEDPRDWEWEGLRNCEEERRRGAAEKWDSSERGGSIEGERNLIEWDCERSWGIVKVLEGKDGLEIWSGKETILSLGELVRNANCSRWRWLNGFNFHKKKFAGDVQVSLGCVWKVQSCGVGVAWYIIVKRKEGIKGDGLVWLKLKWSWNFF